MVGKHSTKDLHPSSDEIKQVKDETLLKARTRGIPTSPGGQDGLALLETFKSGRHLIVDTVAWV